MRHSLAGPGTPARTTIDLDASDYFALEDLAAYARVTLQLRGDERPTTAGRVLRRWYHAKGLTKQVRRHVSTMRPAKSSTARRTRKRKQLLRNNRDFVVVNNGRAFASQLARYLASEMC